MHALELVPYASRLLPSRRPAVIALALAAALAPALPACAPRAIQVTSGPEPASAGLSFTNNLSQPVNVYVRTAGGSETFVRQVAARASEALVLRNVAPGATVSLRAAPVDGSAGYTRDNITVGAGASWRIP